MSYSLVKDTQTGLERADCILRDADGAFIPADPANPDWRAYRAWLAVGNAPTPLPAPSLEELKATKLATLAGRRWQAETADVTVGEHRFATDRQSASILYDAGAEARADPAFSITNWKLADGSFVALDNASLIAAAQAVRSHVQACFDREAVLAAVIAAAPDASALASVDIEAGWPA